MGLLAVAAHAFDAWCVNRVGVTAASSMVLLLASLASGTITQVGRPHPRVQHPDLMPPKACAMCRPTGCWPSRR